MTELLMPIDPKDLEPFLKEMRERVVAENLQYQFEQQQLREISRQWFIKTRRP